MNWVGVIRYIIERTREPSIVHRAVAAIGGIMAASQLSGPEKWIALILGGSAIIGILMPDAVPPENPSGFQDRDSEPLPQPVVAQKDRPVHQPGADPERSNPISGKLRDPVPTQCKFERYRDPEDSGTPPSSGFNG